MRRASRRRHDASVAREVSKAAPPPTVNGAVRRHQPPQEILQQQRKKYQDEVQNLTAKNYRLAKELADLRLKHREECKHVTRLTMENMNLASRCRESISHVAMLKKELAFQQKRTAQALAAQREQTKRMADSLTNSFISFSSTPDSKGSRHGSPHRHASPHRHSSHRSSSRKTIETDEDENLSRLVSSTPSPDRHAIQQRQKTKLVDDHVMQPNSKATVQLSAVTTKSSTRNKKPTSATEESRDSPATTATTAATSQTPSFEEDETLVDSVGLAASSLTESLDSEKNKDQSKQKVPVMYSTPKKSERPKSPSFGDITNDKTELFPVSASPKVFGANRNNKSYDEEFPSDSIDQPESENHGKFPKPKLNLMTSIDAFEQSFSTDFPDSFTPKESTKSSSTPGSGSSQKPYNPFFPTPEKQNSRLLSPEKHERAPDSVPFGTATRMETTGEISRLSPIKYSTPPKDAKTVPLVMEKNDRDLRPRRPEKITPPAARARYERALGTRNEGSTQSKQPIAIEPDTKITSNSKNPTALQRRMQQRSRLNKNLESISNGTAVVKPQSSSEHTRATTAKPVVEPPSSSSEHNHHARKDIMDMVDAFENIENVQNGAIEAEKVQKPESTSRFAGPAKSLRRRTGKKPISYAEPPLNTKLRRGDTFFPKTNPDTTPPNQVPNVIQTSAVVSP